MYFQKRKAHGRTGKWHQVQLTDKLSKCDASSSSSKHHTIDLADSVDINTNVKNSASSGNTSNVSSKAKQGYVSTVKFTVLKPDQNDNNNNDTNNTGNSGNSGNNNQYNNNNYAEFASGDLVYMTNASNKR